MFVMTVSCVCNPQNKLNKQHKKEGDRKNGFKHGRKRLTKDFQRNPPEDGWRKQGLPTGLRRGLQEESGRIRKGR